MRALLDINVLLALTDARHLHHARTRRWREAGLGQHGWASCPLTQNGFLPICTQRAYSSPLPLPDALTVLRRLVARPDHEFWPDDLSILDSGMIDRSRLLGPRQITEIYLLALAVKQGGRLVTLDTGISVQAVKGARKENLLTL